MDTDGGDVSLYDRLRRIAIAAWPFMASLAAMALLLAATVVSIRAIRDRERLEDVATNSAAAAVDAKMAAADAKRAAIAGAEASERNRLLLEQAKPCLAGDPPDSPACIQADQRAVVVNDAIHRIATELAKGLAAHDANVSRQLDALRTRLGVKSPLPPSTPITAAPRPAPSPAVASPPPETTAAPTTTTTTCPKLPNGKCRR